MKVVLSELPNGEQQSPYFAAEFTKDASTLEKIGAAQFAIDVLKRVIDDLIGNEIRPNEPLPRPPRSPDIIDLT